MAPFFLFQLFFELLEKHVFLWKVTPLPVTQDSCGDNTWWQISVQALSCPLAVHRRRDILPPHRWHVVTRCCSSLFDNSNGGRTWTTSAQIHTNGSKYSLYPLGNAVSPLMYSKFINWRHGNRHPDNMLTENPRTWGFEGSSELTSVVL